VPPQVIINQHGVDRVFYGHPWIFRSDILNADPNAAGEVVEVASRQKRFLGQALFNPKSQITLRMITRKKERVDGAFWSARLTEAVRRRGGSSDASRLVFSESDLLPGLIVDRYKDVVVFQTLTLGMDRLKELWIRLLEEQVHPSAIVERNDPPVRQKEGLPLSRGLVRGGISGELIVEEEGRFFSVDPVDGQKTGLFLDQRENRIAVKRYAGGRILDLFCYQGGFAVHLAEKAEQITAVDSSQPALDRTRRNLELNRIENVTLIQANVFDYLREMQDRAERFRMIILDPPPFAASRQGTESGMRGYKEINLRAMRLLQPDGILVTCSCSQNFSEGLFYEMLLDASHDAHREIQLLEKRGAAADHPVLLAFPESYYLQCWIMRVF